MSEKREATGSPVSKHSQHCPAHAGGEHIPELCDLTGRRLERESTADCVVKVLVSARDYDLFQAGGVFISGKVELRRKDDGYVLAIDDRSWG